MFRQMLESGTSLIPFSKGFSLLSPTFSMVKNTQDEKRLLTVLNPYNITPMQYGVLCCLWQEDGLTTTNIAETLKALGGTVTVVLDGLESRHLIKRKRDSTDKRISRVNLTEAGRQLESALVKQVIKLQEEMLDKLTTEEITQFSTTLDKLLT